MSKVFVNIALSLDGYMTPEGMTIDHWDDPGFKNWGAKWGALMSWLIGLEHFRSSLKIGPGGETGPVNDMVRHTSERIGANIMGRRMFEAGERSWPEEAPFHTPVFVLTHNAREPWVRPGGTTFHFVTDGPQSALAQAKAIRPPLQRPILRSASLASRSSRCARPRCRSLVLHQWARSSRPHRIPAQEKLPGVAETPRCGRTTTEGPG